MARAHVLLCIQGEIFAAEGWGKVTGEVGVCIATSGPGATNLVTGLADALLDSVPLVAITGQVRHFACASYPLALISSFGSPNAVTSPDWHMQQQSVQQEATPGQVCLPKSAL